MPKWKIKRNALVQGLFSGSCFLNMALASLFEDGITRNPVLLGSIVLALISASVIATDPQARHHTDGMIWYALVLHLLVTGFVLLASFHWSIVILYILELALCICLWRKNNGPD